jgi:hypothetical protein
LWEAAVTTPDTGVCANTAPRQSIMPKNSNESLFFIENVGK